MFIPKHSKWVSPSGRVFEVVGIWARGGGANYEPVEYELQEGTKPVQLIKIDELVQLIETKKLKTI